MISYSDGGIPMFLKYKVDIPVVPGKLVRKNRGGHTYMARMRRSSEQTLEYKIEQAEAKVAKTREAHEKAVDELKNFMI